ncbi:MAG TPA: hypothetical protein VFG83_08050 [Kofleriaceae bacterium]|nr:hypothetical protein [Kofleriaceae bacterium]
MVRLLAAMLTLAALGCGRIGYDNDPVIACQDMCPGTCDGAVCVLECGDGCLEGIECPPGIACRVNCESSGSCLGGVDCTQASSCEVICQGNGSCLGGIACGLGPCNVSCMGSRSCTGGVECGDACACDVECSGASSCLGRESCPAGCESGAGCSSEDPVCDVCAN